MTQLALSPHIERVEQFLAHCHRRRYPAKSTIIYAGDDSDSLYYVIKGSVTVVIEDEEGREMIVAYLNDGDFFGEMGLFEIEGARSAWVRAKTECEVAEISYTKFNELAQVEPQLMKAIGGQMAKRLRNTTRKVGDLAFLDVTGRVARTLLDLSKQPDAMTHPDGMQIKIYPSGNRPHRWLFTRDGWSRTEEPGRAGPGCRKRQDHGGTRHTLSVARQGMKHAVMILPNLTQRSLMAPLLFLLSVKCI